ncbi:MAG TPA: diacylglycerol kinase family protein, partial [Solirubrobacteraceae bacterium]|nr:diacylglycerol kinase family protein [Solirubrobacteraceae bacterium]
TRCVRVALITNHRSGARTETAALEHGLAGHGAHVETYAIESAGRLRHEGAGRFDRVVVAGGDGSLGPAASAAVALGVPFAVVPTGTANDFARALDIPLDPDEALALAAGAAPGRLEEVDLARVGDRPWLNAASAGLSVLAAREARGLKPSLGALAYAVGAARAAVTGRPLEVTVRADGEEAFAGLAWQVIVGATGAFGGGSEIGGVENGDGCLDAAVVPAGSRVGLVRRAVGMRMGRLSAQRDVITVRARRIEVDVPQATRFNVDGEVCSCVPAIFEIDASAAVVVPA